MCRSSVVIVLVAVIVTPVLADMAHAQPWEIEVATTRLNNHQGPYFQVAVNPDGVVGLAYQDRVGDDYLLYFAERSVEGIWSAPELVNPTPSSFNLAFALAYSPLPPYEAALFFVPANSRAHYFARRLDATWSVETVEERGTRLDREVDLSFAPDGTPWVVYGERRDRGVTIAHKEGASWAKETLESRYMQRKSIAVGPQWIPNPAIAFGSTEVHYAESSGGWDDELVSDLPGDLFNYLSVATDPLDGTPTVLYEHHDLWGYRLARRDSTRVWSHEDSPIADRGCSRGASALLEVLQ